MRTVVFAAVAAGLLSIGSAGAASSRACTSSNLSGRAAFQGATGAAEGGVALVNRSIRSCMLDGRPAISFWVKRERLAVRMTVGTSTSGRKQTATISLRPGERAFVRARWSNWCGRRYRSVAVRLRPLPSGSAVRARGPVAPPRCDARGLASKVAIGPYERLAQPTLAATP